MDDIKNWFRYMGQPFDDVNVVTGAKKTFEDGLKDDLKKKYVKFGSTSGPGSAAGERDSATGQLVPGTETGMVQARSRQYCLSAICQRPQVESNDLHSIHKMRRSVPRAL